MRQNCVPGWLKWIFCVCLERNARFLISSDDIKLGFIQEKDNLHSAGLDLADLVSLFTRKDVNLEHYCSSLSPRSFQLCFVCFVLGFFLCARTLSLGQDSAKSLFQKSALITIYLGRIIERKLVSV